jgi:hypothetical protein
MCLCLALGDSRTLGDTLLGDPTFTLGEPTLTLSKSMWANSRPGECLASEADDRPEPEGRKGESTGTVLDETCV